MTGLSSASESASVATNLLNGALGGLIGMAANLAIDLIVTGITNLINAQENAIKKANEALANLEERREKPVIPFSCSAGNTGEKRGRCTAGRQVKTSGFLPERYR